MIEIHDEIILVPLAELVPYARNSRTHSDEQIEQIAASIREWGWTSPILVDEDGGIIAGHGRVLAATRLEMNEVPTLVARGWTEAQKRAYVIADNQIALNAGWDEEMLASELAAIRDMDFDLDVIGFSLEELERLVPDEGGDGDGDGGGEGEPPVPPEPVIPVTQAGDVWVCGQHRVMCGDSTSKQAIGVLMGGGVADLLLTDPPYNVAYEGKTADALTIQNDSMSDADFRKFLVDVYAAADSAMRPGAVFYIWHADSEGFNFRGAAKDVGWKVRQCLVWAKNSLVMGRQDYHWKHEPCLYGWKDGAAHYWGSDRKQTTLIEWDRPTKSTVHPTMKPVGLFRYQIENSSKHGDVVLDQFGGSGTTLIGCEDSGRLARLMELDPKYVDVIVTRWQEYTGQQATLEATGQTFAEVSAERLG
jgi:DNA modification methylase